MQRMKVVGLGLLSLCLTIVLGAAGSASAAPLLFVPHSGKFPYHFTGTGGKSLLETIGGSQVEAEATDILGLVTNSTLFTLKLEFLKVKETIFKSKCKNEGKTEAVLVSLLGHLGFADPGNKPAALLLVPSGFEFECLGGFAKIKVRGEVIGEIASPGLNTASELMRVVFKQSKGKQEFTTFLLGSSTLTNQFEESALGSGEFEQSGQEGEGDLKALPGQGTFLLVSP